MNLWEGGDSYVELVNRLKPLLGNVLKIQGEQALRNEDDAIVPNGPWLQMNIGTWPLSTDEGGSKEYILLDQIIAT